MIGEAALSELQYPRSWYNLRKSENHIYCDVNGSAHGYFLTSFVPFGYYPTIKQFVAAVNKTLKTDGNGDIWLTFNEVSRKVTVHVKNQARFAFTRWFGNMIGLDKEEVIITKKTEAQLPVDLEAGFHAMYLYTDIVELQLVGNSKVSLLKVIKCDGEFGENVSVNILISQYVLVTVKSFETIQ